MVSILSLRDQHCLLIYAIVRYIHFEPLFLPVVFVLKTSSVYYVSCIHLGDMPKANFIKCFYLGVTSPDVRSEIYFTATRERSRKCDFRPFIRRYTSPYENAEYGYHNSNAPLKFRLKL